MPGRLRLHLTLTSLLAVIALALGACAGPAVVPTEPATSTAAPPASSPTASGITPDTPTPSAPAIPTPIPATSFKFDSPTGVAIDANGNLYAAHCPSQSPTDKQIVKIDTFGLLTVFAGLKGSGFSGDGGPAFTAEFACPAALAFDNEGSLYVADSGNNRIRRIDPNGTVSTVAGGDRPGGASITFSGDGGPALSAQLYHPTAMAFDAAGNLYIDDQSNNRIRKVDPQGIITTVAGTGETGFSGDGGPTTAAKLSVVGFGSNSTGIAIDDAGNLYVADGGNARVRKVDRQGIITTIAGTGELGIAGDGGPATAAQLTRPTSLAFDGEGNLYIGTGATPLVSDNRIRKIDKAGIITTVVGTGEQFFSGDGGPATLATIREPWGIVFDPDGNLYFSDTGNSFVRKVDRDGIITTVVGDVP